MDNTVAAGLADTRCAWKPRQNSFGVCVSDVTVGTATVLIFLLDFCLVAYFCLL
jgi:hypothetical protein